MAAPTVSMQRAASTTGAHFGHQTHRWNPKMKPYHLRRPQRRPHHRSLADRAADGACAGIHCVSHCVASGGKVLFVGTKRQAQEPIAEAARRSGQHYRQPSLAWRHA